MNEPETSERLLKVEVVGKPRCPYDSKNLNRLVPFKVTSLLPILGYRYCDKCRVMFAFDGKYLYHLVKLSVPEAQNNPA